MDYCCHCYHDKDTQCHRTVVDRSAPSTGRKSLKKKWNNTPVEESAQRCSDWLSPPSDELAMASPGRQKRRSYTIKKEIPAPNLDD